MKYLSRIAVPSSLKKIESHEFKLVFLSAVYFFCLLCAYFILRPLRDEMGIVNGAINMQWLFTGTFVAMVAIVPLFGFLVSKTSLKRVLLISYGFFIANILLFYALFEILGPLRSLAICFFIWLSVFNLFVVSLFWSFMADLFSSASSKRFFGIIASGGSLGALSGPVIVKQLSAHISISAFLLIAASFLIAALICIFNLLKLSNRKKHFNTPATTSSITIKKLFEGVQSIGKSTYLQGIVTFILLYTAISTVLYFEQAHLVESTLTESSERIGYFANIDFWVNAIAIFGQFFLTGQIIRTAGLSLVLSSIPFIVGIGLIILGQNPTLVLIGILMVVHRSGNFMLLKPSREILFTVTSPEGKYQAKNCIDTAIYRGGDAIVGWLFAGLVAMSWGLGAIAFLAVPIAFLWSLVGFKLGMLHQKKENTLPLNTKIYENNV